MALFSLKMNKRMCGSTLGSVCGSRTETMQKNKYRFLELTGDLN